uniref:Tetratricopeptide repeat protein n=1 Tax=Roseihalotalea indica TaxID=2867963 RepID=A0AA49GPI4_9BACT|nr:tetratricopeptide repeat protein [Tunicatimonas sp. TK19036]
MKISHLKRSIWFGCVLLLFMASSTYAQRDKSSREDRKIREATYYFTEGAKYYILEDMEKALALFEKSLESDPDNDAAHFKIADIFSRQGILDKALYHANQAIELSPDNKYYYLTKAGILTQQSNFEEAAQVYETMIDRLDKTDDYLFDLAALYLYQQKFDQAIETYDRIEQKYGLLPEVITAKQRIYLQQNKLNMAIAEGERLIENFPGEGSYVIALSEIFISNGKDREAIPYLESLLEEAPDNPEAELLLAKIYQNLGEDAKAEEHMGVAFTNPNLSLKLKLELVAKYIQELPDPNTQQLVSTLTDKILESHPEEADAYILKGDFLNAIDSTSKARDYYLKSTKYDDTNFNVWQNLLTIEFQTLQETDSVIKHSEQALEMFPNQGIVYFYNGAAHAAKQNYDEAAYSLDQAKRLSNNAELTQYCNIYLGDVYNGLEQYDKSSEAYEAVLKADPSNDYVLNNYSYFLAIRQEKLPYAKQLSTRLLELNPENANYLDTHGWVLYMMGEYKQAKKYIEQALEKGAGSGEVVEHYGDILFKLGDVDQAVQQWMKAKGMDDASELIDKKIADRKLYE